MKDLGRTYAGVISHIKAAGTFYKLERRSRITQKGTYKYMTYIYTAHISLGSNLYSKKKCKKKWGVCV